jgi:putative ABC transport system permease protein
VSWISQFVATLRLYLGDWPSRPGTLLVAVLGAAGTTFILVSVLSIANGVRDATERAGEGDIAVIIQRGAPMEMASTLSDDDIDAIFSAAGDAILVGPGREHSVSEELVRTMDTISRGGEAGAQVLGRGLTAPGLTMRRGFRIVSGRAFTPGKLEVIVGRRLARDFSGLAVGTTLTGSANEWLIVGVFEAGGGPAESEVWMDFETARNESGPHGDASSLRIRLASVLDLPRVRAAIESDPRRQLQVVAEREYHARQSLVLIERIRMLAVGLTLLLGIGAVVATVNAMYGVITARQRSVATLRVLGFGSATVAAAVFVEASLLGLIGGIAGGLAAYALADGFGLSLLNVTTNTPLALDAHVTFMSLLQGVTIGVLLGILSAVLPSIMVARLPILSGLRP